MLAVLHQLGCISDSLIPALMPFSADAVEPLGSAIGGASMEAVREEEKCDLKVVGSGGDEELRSEVVLEKGWSPEWTIERAKWLGQVGNWLGLELGYCSSSKSRCSLHPRSVTGGAVVFDANRWFYLD